MNDLELEIKQLIVKVLKLEGLQPAAIDSVEPLFVEGLGLDSIDALELGVAIRKKYSVTFDAVKEDVKRHFLNVRNLAQFVRSQQERSDGHTITQ
jgi:acyl carrier protein